MLRTPLITHLGVRPQMALRSRAKSRGASDGRWDDQLVLLRTFLLRIWFDGAVLLSAMHQVEESVAVNACFLRRCLR